MTTTMFMSINATTMTMGRMEVSSCEVIRCKVKQQISANHGVKIVFHSNKGVMCETF